MSDQRQHVQRTHIPTLDGWRAIAILLVVVDHFHRYPSQWLDYIGQHGVGLFFVLSGFLITTTLLEERDWTGHISLRRFYARRFFRLFPASALYLVLVALLFGISPLTPCFLFFRNFVHGSLYTDHFWSLSLEEQFYLFWPALLVNIRPKRLVWFAILGAAGVALCRGYESHYLATADFWRTLRTQFRADALLIGCAMAFLMRSKQVRNFFARFPLWPALVLLVACTYKYHRMIPIWESILIACILGKSSLLSPRRWERRALEFQPVAWLGRISYSLYLWQQLPVALVGPVRTLHPLLRLSAAFVLAVASYYGVERPFRKFRLRFSSVPKPAKVPSIA